MYKSSPMQNSWSDVRIVGILAVLYESFPHLPLVSWEGGWARAILGTAATTEQIRPHKYLSTIASISVS